MDYLCIDLKSFYASVECVERNLDPLKTLLVVSDPTRGPGALCLAVSPLMKQYGVSSRTRLIAIPKELKYIIAKPRMKKYIEYSSLIYSIYLKYISKDDMHIYSIDEVFLDVTNYKKLYNKTATEIGQMIIDDIFNTTGITATCGVSTNLFLTKVALDILAKKIKSNIAYLDEELFKRELWDHVPLTDFWQVGRGISNRLNKLGLYTMRDVAICDEEKLYKEFGKNAANLIEHASGKEECTISDIKAYKPKNKSMSSGQTFTRNYEFEESLLALKEMVELMCLDLIKQKLVTNNISVYASYAHGLDLSPTGASVKLSVVTNSYEILLEEFITLYTKSTHKDKPIRKIGLGFNNLKDDTYEQYSLFEDQERIEREKKLNETIVSIKDKFGKESVMRAMNLEEGATTRNRHKMIGGHNSE